MKLHVLLFKETNQDGDWWVAQCLEYDIAAQAKTIPDVEHELARVFAGQMILRVKNGQQPLEGIPQAPRKFWERFAQARQMKDDIPAFTLPPEVPPAFIIPEYESRVC